MLFLAAGAALFYFFNSSRDTGQALATVNGEMITVDHFLQEVEKIPEPNRGMFKEEPAKFLEMLIDLLPQTSDIKQVEEKIFEYVDSRIKNEGI